MTMYDICCRIQTSDTFKYFAPSAVFHINSSEYSVICYLIVFYLSNKLRDVKHNYGRFWFRSTIHIERFAPRM